MRRHLTKCRILVALILISSPGFAGDTPDERDWPFHPLHPVEPPAVQSDWIRNGIDAFVLRELRSNGLQPAPQADRRMLIRRLYFDLIGLPPEPAEVDGILSDHSERAWESLVDRLLEDPRYGERWGRLWLDLARYADTAGYEGDPDLPHAWRYRDYVIDAFNSDKPYDEFIREQIAGDEFDEVMGAGDLPSTPPERTVAMTFLRLAPFTEPRGDETRHEMLSEMTSTVGSVFLGLTVGCAKCHDHKYDDIPTEDFYRLKAFFATVSLPPPEPGDAYQIGGSLPAAFYRGGEHERVEQSRRTFTLELDEVNEQLQNLTARLKEALVKAGMDENHFDAVIDDSGNHLFSAEDRKSYQQMSARRRMLRQQIKRLKPVAMSLRHSYGPPYEPGVPTSRVMIRGEYDNPGEVVEPGFLSCITGNQEPAHIRLDPFKRWPTRSRRMALADWIASPDNPMTARVMVNRLWHWHFGRGIVATPSDFGQLSGGPSHPEMLDWLASRFVNKWSIKSIHRLIVTSAAYQQTSLRVDENAARFDPDNTLLWRFRRRRLEAEAIRDAVLAVSGRLNPEQFGLPIFPPLPDDIEERVKYETNKWDTQEGPASRKRSIYIYQQRTLTMPFLQSFDALVCDESRPMRRHSVTPLQALAMYNGRLVNEEVPHFANRVRAESAPEADSDELIERAFRIALCRSPNPDEISEMELLMHSSGTGLEGVCRVLLNLNEFVCVD